MYNAEKRGKRQVLVRPVSKVVIKFLQVMQKHGTFTFSFSTKRDETRVRREGETLMEFFFDLSSSGKSLAFFLFILDVREVETRTRGARVRGLGGRLDFYARKEDRSGGKDPCLEIFVLVVVVGPRRRRRRRRRKKQTALFSS
jgi:hypothetical protein